MKVDKNIKETSYNLNFQVSSRSDARLKRKAFGNAEKYERKIAANFDKKRNHEHVTQIA